jgi:predicted CXXCH cytochrome family protein
VFNSRVSVTAVGRLPAAILLVLLLASPATGEIRVYYPPSGTMVEGDTVVVEGMVSDRDLYEFELTVNGEETHTVPVRDFLFSVEVDLVPGVNGIRFGDESVSVFSADGSEAEAEGYRRMYGHKGLYDGCAECHELSDSGKLSFAGSAEEVCEWCHGDLVRSTEGKDLKSVHAPVEAGRCLTCHSAHLSEKPGLPAKEVPECKVCHRETYDRMETERYVHGPMHLGDCRLCHTVHSSPQQALLNDSLLTICPQCHFDVAVEEDTPPELTPHVLIPQGLCSRCHFPHSSENPKLMREPAARICLNCHPKKGRSFHEEKGFSIYGCAKCHDLHYPTGPGLMIDSSRFLCLECHQFEEEAAFTHSFVKEGDCFICHTFHASPLAGDSASICLKCHAETPGLDESHGGIDIRSADCTGCHQPHQSTVAKLLYTTEHTPFAERDCAACHDERSDLLGGKVQKLCVSCHEDKDVAAAARTGREVHPPAQEKDCTFCHRTHASDEEGFLQRPQLEMCVKCHIKLKKVTVLKPRSSHEAVLKGECSNCHDPHTSDQRSFLRLPQSKLCLSCHDGMLAAPDGTAWTSTHPPVAEGKCKLCHNPHTSRKPSLLRYSLPQACRPCHQELFKRIKSNGKGKTHRPVNEGKCRACHKVHGSEVRSLLSGEKTEELCRACHESPQSGHHLFTMEEIREKTGVSGKDACLICHRPHTAESGRLLIRSSSDICQGCHKI